MVADAISIVRQGASIASIAAHRRPHNFRTGFLVPKIKLLSTDLALIFAEELRQLGDCNPYIAIAIIPDGESGWMAVTDKKLRNRFPKCKENVERLQKKLRHKYALAGS